MAKQYDFPDGCKTVADDETEARAWHATAHPAPKKPPEIIKLPTN